MAIMVHFGIFMEMKSYPMTCQVTHDAIAVFLAMFLDGMANVAYAASMPISRHSFVTLTNCSFSGVVLPMMNMREASA